MSEPIQFTSASPRFVLPLLFAGQAQKEFFVNEALCRADALLHPATEGEVNDPPPAPEEGECWLVGAEPTGAWAGHAGQLAMFAGGWVFAEPRDGMRLLDRSTGQHILYRDGWQRPAAPAAPSGGETVDNEARAAITALIGALISGGILA